MRNLKRVLALALALIMTLGLMITASAASYPDADQIDAKYNEAIEVLSGLGVFKGQGNGGTTNFAPKAILTRGEVATLVYRILTGDVTDAQIRNYDYTSFDDVLEGQWWTGYITYAANGGYVKGYDGHFYPQDEVTGVQVLAIMLRAIGRGQNGEYEGAAWKDNVLTDARDLGLLKGISTDDLDKGAERQLVAQLLFNAITIPNIVTYSALLGYQVTPEKQTLGNKTFGLVRFEGVVTANEYADLYADKPLAAGKTEIDGVKYSVSTALTDIGESRRGWAYGKSNTVVFIEDTGDNVIFETGAATELDSKFEKANGITDDTERFLNFGQGSAYTCEYLLTYGYVGGKDDNGDAFDEQVIKAGKAVDVDALRDIFNSNNGYVYVGTKNTVNGEDLSDTMTFKKFKAEYLTEDLSEEIKATVNGDWLKVIDNDNDGEADYVLKTVFEMNEVDAVSKKGNVTMVDKITAIDDETVEAADLVASDELAKGDIVITTTIDGITYIDLADSVTGDVDSYSMKNDILTVDGVEYGQSDISNQTDYQEEISNAEKKTEYTFYLDHFGYIRIFAYPAAAEGNYLLLTDGWYNETRTADEYAVKAYLDGEIQDIDVNAKKVSGFIYDDADTQNNSWGNLVDFDAYQGKNAKDQKSVTNIAAYTLSSDNVLSLSDVKTYNYDKKNVKTGVDVDYVDLDEVALAKGQSAYAGQYTADASDKADWAVDEGNVTVQATKNTVFYYVTLNNKGGVKSVKTVVGYKNSVAVAADNINAAYAVATNTGKDASGENYWVADVIVVEINKDTVSYEDVFFNAYAALKTVKDTVNSDAILATGKTGELVLDISEKYNDYRTTNGYKVPLWFYQKTEADADGVVGFDKIEADYADYGIYTATADRVNGLMTYLTTTDGTALEYSSDDVTVYALTASKSDKYGDPITSAVTEVNDKAVTVKAGDELIVFCDGKKLTNVVYVINVTKSVDASKLDTGIEALYDDIEDDATPPAPVVPVVPAVEDNLYSVTVKGVKAEATDKGAGTKADPFIYLAEVDSTDTTTDRLTVVATDRDATVNIHYTSFDAAVQYTGTGEATDTSTGAANPGVTVWYVEVEGVYYEIHVQDSSAVLQVGDYTQADGTCWQNFKSGDWYVAYMAFENTKIDADDIATVAFTLKDASGKVVATVTSDEAQVDAYVAAYSQYWPTNGGNYNYWEIYIPNYLVADFLLQTTIVDETETITRPADFQASIYPDLDVSVVVTMEDGTVYSVSE